MFFHQLLEMPERRNLAEVRVHSVRPGLGAENLCGFINRLSSLVTVTPINHNVHLTRFLLHIKQKCHLPLA